MQTPVLTRRHQSLKIIFRIGSGSLEYSDKLAYPLAVTLRIAQIFVSKLFVLKDFVNLDRFLLINSWSKPDRITLCRMKNKSKEKEELVSINVEVNNEEFRCK